MTIHYDTTGRAERDANQGRLTKWARSLRAKCRTPRRMLEVARTLQAMQARSERAPGLRLTAAELQQAHSRGVALEAESKIWAEETRRAA